jgi:hypothetical protein
VLCYLLREKVFSCKLFIVGIKANLKLRKAPPSNSLIGDLVETRFVFLMDFKLKFLSFLLTSADNMVPLFCVDLASRLHPGETKSLPPLDRQADELPVLVADREHPFTVSRLLEHQLRQTVLVTGTFLLGFANLAHMAKPFFSPRLGALVNYMLLIGTMCAHEALTSEAAIVLLSLFEELLA